MTVTDSLTLHLCGWSLVWSLCGCGLSELPGETLSGGGVRHITGHQLRGGGGGGVTLRETLSRGGVVDQARGVQLELLGCIGLHLTGGESEEVRVHRQTQGTMFEPSRCQLHPALHDTRQCSYDKHSRKTAA